MRPHNPDIKLLDVKIEYLEMQRSRLWGETSQKLSENTGETLNKYPASLSQNRCAVNHTADKNNTWKCGE